MYHKLKKCLNSRSSNQRSSIEKAVLKNFAVFTRKHLCWSLLLIDLWASRPATLLKRDSSTGAFLWILQNFQEHLFWRKSVNNCFCHSYFLLLIFLLKGLFLLLIRKSSSRFKKFSLGCLVGGSSLIWKKEKLAEMVTLCHSFSFVVTRCHSLYHSLSFAVTRCTTCCHLLYHSLSFVVTRCHSLSLVVPVGVTRCHSMYNSSVFL